MIHGPNIICIYCQTLVCNFIQIIPIYKNKPRDSYYGKFGELEREVRINYNTRNLHCVSCDNIIGELRYDPEERYEVCAVFRNSVTFIGDVNRLIR